MLIPEGALLFALHPGVVDAALGRKVPQEVWSRMRGVDPVPRCLMGHPHA